MSSYTEAPAPYRRDPDRPVYTVELPFVWELGYEGSGLAIEVPKGFVFDVSIPWALRWLFSPDDPRFLKAAALHDRLLELGWNRVSAAGPFHAALKADGVGSAWRLAMLLGVILWRWS